MVISKDFWLSHLSKSLCIRSTSSYERSEPSYLASLIFKLLVFALLLIGHVPAQTSGRDLETVFRAGQTALQQGDFNKAIEDFKQVLALDPTVVEAEVNLGLAYQSLLDYEAAARALAHALRKRPTLPGVNIIVGLDYMKLGSPDKAAPYIRYALQLDSSNRDAHDAMALYYLTQENIQGAAEQYRKLADLTPDKPDALYDLGHRYIDLAARLAYQGARLYPDSPWGHRFLGDLLSERDRWEDAAREYKKALAIDAKQSGLHTLLGEAWLYDGKLGDAESEFRSELQLDPRSEQALLGLATVELANERPLDALASVDEVWRESPEFLKTHPDFNSLLLAAPIAQKSVSQLLQEPETPGKHFLLSALYASVNQNVESDRQAQAFRSDVSEWHQDASRAHKAIGPCGLHLYSECIAWLEKRKLQTSSGYLLLGKTYFTLHQYERAAEALARVHGDKNALSEASYWMERSYQASAVEAYSQLEASYPDSWRAHELRAEDFSLRQDRNNALKEYETALHLRPENAELHESLGEFYLDNRSDQDAQRELEKAFALDPSSTKTLYLLGRLYVLNDENEKALPFLRRAVQLQPNLNEASGLLGTAYVRLGKFAEAVPTLTRAARLDHYGNFHYQLYVAYRKLGEIVLAQKALARSNELRRDSLEHDQAVVMGPSRVEPDSQ